MYDQMVFLFFSVQYQYNKLYIFLIKFQSKEYNQSSNQYFDQQHLLCDNQKMSKEPLLRRVCVIDL